MEGWEGLSQKCLSHPGLVMGPEFPHLNESNRDDVLQVVVTSKEHSGECDINQQAQPTGLHRQGSKRKDTYQYCFNYIFCFNHTESILTVELAHL
jgi:hypothetical protein